MSERPSAGLADGTWAALALTASAFALSACASAPVGDHSAISERLAAQLGAAAPWARTEAGRSEAAARVEQLLAAPLDQTSAVQLALARNPRVLAAFEGLGVAEADLYDAILPPNPALSFLRLEPEGGGADMLKYGAAIDLLRLITLPANITAGQGRRDAARAQATADVLQVAASARFALIDYVAVRQQADLMSQARETAAAAAAAADALYAAGNIAKADRDREALFAAEIDLAFRQASAELTPARERLLAALALSGEQAQRLQTVDRLPLPPNEPLDIADIEARVVGASADIAMAAGALQAARAEQSISWLTSLLPGLSIEAEREREDEWKEGFGFDLSLPVFGLGGADRLRRSASRRQADALLQAVDLEIRSEARSLLANTENARQIALLHRDVMLPLSSDVFEGAQLDFNAMQIGVFQLLEAKRLRLDSGRRAVQATRDYWMAQARLDLLLAGLRPDAPDSPKTLPAASLAAADPGH